MNLFDFFFHQSQIKHADGTRGIPGFTGTTGLDDYSEAQFLAEMYKDTCIFGNDPQQNNNGNFGNNMNNNFRNNMNNNFGFNMWDT